MSKRVVFDLGQVIVLSDSAATQSGHLNEKEWEDFTERSEFWQLNEALDRGRSVSEVMRYVKDRHRGDIAIWERFFRNYRLSLTGVVPGMRTLISQLHANRVKTAVLSNWGVELFQHTLAAHPFIEDLGPRIVSGYEGIAKPDRAIFELAQKRFHTPLKDMIMVDDREDNIAAAQAVGMEGIRFIDAEQLAQELASRGLLGPDQVRKVSKGLQSGRLAP
ncbi:MAG: HAD family phosphatase [Actinomycetaceae bacterium]|nr:HAD family phosphatase [Actinomycetaceae bacterium]